MDDDLRKQVGEVLTDYRDGLLDSLEDGVDAILQIPAIAERLALQPIKPLERNR